MKNIISHITLIAGLGAVSVAAQQDFSNVEIKTTQLADHVYMLEGAGGNVGLSVGPDGVLMIDNQFAPLAEKLEAAAAKLTGQPLRFLVNTHWHGDHTGGNEHFGAKSTVVAHENVRVRLADKSGTAAASLPVITYQDGLSIHFNGEEIRLRHLPRGHTDGDSVVHFTESNVVHMGDQLFNRRFPYIDLGSGGSVEGYLKNLESVLKWIPEDAKIIPGHGPRATVEDLRDTHKMLVAVTEKVKAGIASGKTMEQVKADGVPAQYKDWAWNFITESRFLEICYNDLGK